MVVEGDLTIAWEFGVLAHIVGAGPQWPLWITATMLFGGALGVMVARSSLRRVCMVISGVGLVATVAVYTLLLSAPIARPGTSLEVLWPTAASAVTSPVVIVVCGSAGAPGPGQLISISVDGRQVAETRNPTIALGVQPGRHSLRVELVTSDHREYSPPVLTDTDFTVSETGPVITPPTCRSPSPSP